MRRLKLRIRQIYASPLSHIGYLALSILTMCGKQSSGLQRSTTSPGFWHWVLAGVGFHGPDEGELGIEQVLPGEDWGVGTCEEETEAMLVRYGLRGSWQIKE